MQQKIQHIIFYIILITLSACSVGPDYKRPSMPMPAKYKEATTAWQIATPQDQYPRGKWWEIFADPQLNALEDTLNKNNQSIAAAAASYAAAEALVDAARANYFPTINAATQLTRQKQASSNSSKSTFSTAYTFGLDTSWEIDLWGDIRRSVESSQASAQASAALLAATQLSAQASLAQYYFELHFLDNNQIWLNNIVVGYKKILALTQNLYHAGVKSHADVLAAQTQFENVTAQAANNKINRAQYEHAIAILIGQAPATFSLVALTQPKTMKLPDIPATLPSGLLEHRPDIAQAERQVAAANAQIGVATAAYFPKFTLNLSSYMQSNELNKWLSYPDLVWSLGPELAETIFNGGLRSANVKIAKANYRTSVANYRQTVLVALQEVEDNLAALHYLNQEATALTKAAINAKNTLSITNNEYNSGTVSRIDVTNAQIARYQAETSLNNTNGLCATTIVALIKNIGAGWDAMPNKIGSPGRD